MGSGDTYAGGGYVWGVRGEGAGWVRGLVHGWYGVYMEGTCGEGYVCGDAERGTCEGMQVGGIVGWGYVGGRGVSGYPWGVCGGVCGDGGCAVGVVRGRGNVWGSGTCVGGTLGEVSEEG